MSLNALFYFFTFSSKIESLLVDDLSSALVGRQDSGRHDRRGPASNRKQLDGGHFDFDLDFDFDFSKSFFVFFSLLLHKSSAAFKLSTYISGILLTKVSLK